MTATDPTEFTNRRVTPFDPHNIAEEVARFVPADALARWCAVDRSAHRPQLLAIYDDANEVLGLALLTARPGTAYVKIVDALGDLAEVVDAVASHARDRGAVAIKWEGWRVGDVPLSLGFSRLSAPRTRGVEEPYTGFVRWLGEPPASEPGHYRQTTHFTCGAVCVSIAHTHLGNLRPADFDRSHELSLWREATNFFACDPVRLALAAKRRWPDTEVSVTLDADGPVLIDAYSGGDQSWRSVLQELSLREAEESRLSMLRHRISLDEIRASIGASRPVALLVSLTAMMGIDAPHWLLCHGLVDGAVIAEDPWVSTEVGESWVDSHMLPIADAGLEDMSIMENGRYRAAVTIGNAASPF